MKTYEQLYANLKEKEAAYKNLEEWSDMGDVIAARGRYLGALQSVIKSCKREGKDYSKYIPILKQELADQKKQLATASRSGFMGKYSIVKELSYGLKLITNSIKARKYATTEEEKQKTKKDILRSLGRGAFNTLKGAVIVVGTVAGFLGITTIVSGASLAFGAMQFVWNAKSKHDNKPISNMSNGLKNIVKGLGKDQVQARTA